MTTVFDISQTDGIDDAEVIGEAFEVPNPAALLADTLTDQLERRGYTVEETTDAAIGHIHDDRAVIPAGAPVRELARALSFAMTATTTRAGDAAA